MCPGSSSAASAAKHHRRPPWRHSSPLWVISQGLIVAATPPNQFSSATCEWAGAVEMYPTFLTLHFPSRC